MRLAIVGSRHYRDFDTIEKVVVEHIGIGNITCIVSGGARGVDALAERLAARYNIPTDIYLPNYELHGQGATFVRNRQIVDNSDALLAFQVNKSSGTQHTVDYAIASKKPCKVVNPFEYDDLPF